jgi:hypothetical protein
MDAMMQRQKDTASDGSGHPSERDARRAASRRTALVLASIAAVFFAGIILAQYSGSPSVGIGVLGFAILGFLVVAIGRNIRK